MLFKLILKGRQHNRIQNPTVKDDDNSFDVTSRREESIALANLSFADGVATKDINIEPSTSLSIPIFVPDTCLVASNSNANARVSTKRPRAQSR